MENLLLQAVEVQDRSMPRNSRWSPDDKIRIVLESLNTNISMSELSQEVQPHSRDILPVEGEIHSRWKACPHWRSEGSGEGEGGRGGAIEEAHWRTNNRKRRNEAGTAGIGEKMSVAIMVNKGLSLRKALRSVGSSQGAYYYKRHTRQDKGDSPRSVHHLDSQGHCSKEAYVRN